MKVPLIRLPKSPSELNELKTCISLSVSFAKSHRPLRLKSHSFTKWKSIEQRCVHPRRRAVASLRSLILVISNTSAGTSSVFCSPCSHIWFFARPKGDVHRCFCKLCESVNVGASTSNYVRISSVPYLNEIRNSSTDSWTSKWRGYNRIEIYLCYIFVFLIFF